MCQALDNLNFRLLTVMDQHYVRTGNTTALIIFFRARFPNHNPSHKRKS